MKAKFGMTQSLAIGVALLISSVVTANPLCPNDDERESIRSALLESPNGTPAQIARHVGLPEAAVAHAMPAEARVPVPIEDLEKLWQQMAEWEDALVIALSSQSVFEMAGPLPSGSVGRGYFNFDSADSPYGGHLKMDRLATIYLLSVAGERGETHQVAFYDLDGRRVFSVYVPRDDSGALNSQVYSQFIAMKRDYADMGEGSSQTDTSCSTSVNGGAQ